MGCVERFSAVLRLRTDLVFFATSPAPLRMLPKPAADFIGAIELSTPERLGAADNFGGFGVAPGMPELKAISERGPSLVRLGVY